MNSGAEAGIAILAVGGLSVVATIVGIRRRERTGGLGRVPPPSLDDAVPPGDGEYPLVLRGGAWVNGLNVTWPLACLLVDRERIELRAYAVEPIRVGRGEVVGLRWVAGPFGRGIKFRTSSGRLDKVTFWPVGRARRPLDALGWN